MDALLGAYVLDALEADERALVEDVPRHATRAPAPRSTSSARPPRCSPVRPRSTTTAPPELWARIAAEVEASDDAAARADAADELATRGARKASRARDVDRLGGRRGRGGRSSSLLAVQVVSLNDELDDERNHGERRGGVRPAPAEAEGARQADARRPRTATLARVVLLPDGTGYLVNDELAPLCRRRDVPAVGDRRRRRRGPRRSRPACSVPIHEALPFKVDGPGRRASR